MILKEEEQEMFSPCDSQAECSVEKTLNLIGGKWTILVIKNLFPGKKRFGEMRRLLHNINAKSLTKALRSLEENGLVNRVCIPTVPVTVEYSLTEKGECLKLIIKEMYLWGEEWA